MKKQTDLEKKVKEMHPSEGRVRDDGGSRSVETMFLDNEKKVVAYSLESGNWNPYGGVRNSGITKWQGINIYDGQNEIEIKPMAMWKDGENQYNDNPANHYFIKELEKTDKRNYRLILENANGIIEIHQIDLGEKKSKLLESVKGSEYLERKEDKTIEEKSALIRRKCYEILDQNNPRGSNSIKNTCVLDLENKVLSEEPSTYQKDGDKKIDEWYEEVYSDALKNPKGKLILFVTSEALYGNSIRGKLIAANPSSLKINPLINCKYSDSFENLDLSLNKKSFSVFNKYFNKVKNTWKFDLKELKEKFD